MLIPPPLFPPTPGLSEATIAHARRYAGRNMETLGRNDGPEIREWLSALGIRQPAAWCAAFATAMIREAAKSIGHKLDFRGSAGALRLLDVNQDLRIAEPEPGCLVIWDHGGGNGHVGIVTGVTRIGGELASIECISGNTNAESSRDADSVVERDFTFPQARQVAGYLRIV